MIEEENQNKKETKNQLKMNVELPKEIEDGNYSNLVMITHSNAEFVLDFIRLMPNVPKAKVISRIIVTPEHVTRLLNALKDNIEKHERRFGPIKSSSEEPPFLVNFGGKMGEA